MNKEKILLELLIELSVIREEKKLIISTQKYEEAAYLRDKERSFEIKIIDAIYKGSEYPLQNHDYKNFNECLDAFLKKEYNCNMYCAIDVISMCINREEKLNSLGL